MNRLALPLLFCFPLLCRAQTPGPVPPTNATSAPPAPASDAVTVQFIGGFDTDLRDRGRPVVLIAAALAVPDDVFREAFTHVRPAPTGEQPQPDQVRCNKQALMEALGPLGVTDDRLNTVSNYYRYRRDQGEWWRHTPASALAYISHGVVTSITVVEAGSGYSSPPTVSIPGIPQVQLKAILFFGTDLATNGSVRTITVVTDKAPAKNGSTATP